MPEAGDFPKWRAASNRGRLELRTETWAGTDGTWCPRRGARDGSSKEAVEEDGRRGVKRWAEGRCPGGSVRADKGGEDAKERRVPRPPSARRGGSVCAQRCREVRRARCKEATWRPLETSPSPGVRLEGSRRRGWVEG